MRFAHRASNCTILLFPFCQPFFLLILFYSSPSLISLNSLPVRPLLVKHTMSTVPAADRLAALQRNVHVAVAAFVQHGARGCVDGGGRGGVDARGCGLGRVVGGHFLAHVFWCMCFGERNSRCGCWEFGKAGESKV